MQTVQRLLLLLFATFAALTVLQQIRYGMICGRSEQEDKQDDPKAKACRQQSTIYAIAAAVSLIVNIIIGALSLYLDYINIFLYILRMLGRRSND